MTLTSGSVSPLHRRARSVLTIALSAVCVAAGAGPARAEAPRFTAEVDRNQVGVGEPFIYQVTLSVGNDEVTDYRPPDFKGLRVLRTPGAPNQSTQMQFGGAGMFVQVSYSWRYEISAAQKGTIAIGPARVRVNGQEFRSSVATVSASGAGAPAGPPPIAGAPPPPSNPPAGTSSAGPPPGGPPPEAAEGGSFVRLVTDKQRVFVGEAVSATWYLYVNQTVDRYEPQVEPHTEGFWTEDVQVPARRGGLVLNQEVVQGRPYQVGVILKKALFPLQNGHLTITPMEVEIGRSDFFGNTVRSQRVRSMATVVEVLPLPRAGQPTGFDAANVGSFTLTARVDRAEVAVGEAVTLTIEVGGRGNLRKLAMPAIPRLDGWKAYEPRVTVVVDPASGVTGTKTAEVLLLPERPGTVTLPALGLETFEPETGRYARIQTNPIRLTATGDARVAAGPAATGAGAGAPGAGGFSENVIAGEIRPLHARPGLRRDLGTTFFRTRIFAGVLGFPPLAFALFVVAFRIRDRLAEDTGSRRRRRARKKVRAHLSAADGHLRRGETGAFFIEIDRVIREALASRLGRPVNGLRMDELGTVLAARGLAAAEIDRVIALLEECDRARFAPGSVGGGVASLRATLDLSSDLIELIEKTPLSEENQA